MDADRYLNGLKEEVKHIALYETDFELPANGVSMPVITSDDEAKYQANNLISDVDVPT